MSSVAERICDHCGQTMGDFAGGSAGLSRDGKNYNLCHPNDPRRGDCYTLVTVYGQPIGKPDAAFSSMTEPLSRWMRGDL